MTYLCCCVTLLAATAAAAAAAAIGDLAGNPVALGLPLSTYSATTQAKSINNRETVGMYCINPKSEADINNNPGDIRNVCITTTNQDGFMQDKRKWMQQLERLDTPGWMKEC